MTALALFIDNPEHASPKPALAAVIPAESASKALDGISSRLRNLVALFAGEKYLFYSHFPNWNDSWDINLFRKRIQTGETLADRIGAAVMDLSDENPETIVWMSTDAVAVGHEQLEAFTSAAAKSDLVIGETADGAILMLGLGRNAFSFEIPAELSADAIALAAATAGLSVLRMALPAPPASVEDLTRLGINLD